MPRSWVVEVGEPSTGIEDVFFRVQPLLSTPLVGAIRECISIVAFHGPDLVIKAHIPWVVILGPIDPVLFPRLEPEQRLDGHGVVRDHDPTIHRLVGVS